MSEKSIEINKLDSNMSIDTGVNANVRWHSPKEAPFYLAGFPWLAKDGVYRRLPVNPGYEISEAVNTLADCTAGGQICFKTDSSRLFVKVTLQSEANMYHMPATGQCGFDCYIGEPGQQLYLSTSKYDHSETCYEASMYEFDDMKLRNVTLNFPLYQGVKEVLVGLDEGACIYAPSPFRNGRPVIFYGTSITQGGCASRPGMAYTNILSRYLNRECINLGFSGNGRGEPELAKLIAEIENPACYVLDYEANSSGAMQKTLPEFIRILRCAHPEVPILVLSKISYSKENFYASGLTGK